MIFAPPQVGKSQLASVCLPAYWLGRRPDDPVILTSYAASLAYSKRFGATGVPCIRLGPFRVKRTHPTRARARE